MNVTDEELIVIWRYFQYCCLPSIIMARYAYLDYIGDIKADKAFCRHETKQAVNRVGKYLDNLPNKLMNVNSQNVRYMNILGDNIDEQFETDVEELHRAIYISFRNAKMKHLDCLTALHYISVMLQIASVTFSQCCHDMYSTMHKNPTKAFHVYNLKEVSDSWGKIVDKASSFYGYDKENRHSPSVDLNNLRCTKAVDNIRRKLACIDTLRIAMQKSYPWSPNYQEGVPYEQSADFLIVNNNNGN